jgi:hypothetical protein
MPTLKTDPTPGQQNGVTITTRPPPDIAGAGLVVTCQQSDADVMQMVFYREDIPDLPEECQEKVRRWLADQQKTDARREAEKN